MIYKRVKINNFLLSKLGLFGFALVAFALVLVSCSKEEEIITPPAPNKYTITVTAEAGGSVSSPGGTYNEGSKITITATPDGQYLFDKWSDGSTVNPREITVTANLTLSATFVKKTYPLSVTIEGEGTVQEEVIIQGSTSQTEHKAGTTVRLTATPNEGWVFAGWSGDVESEEKVIEVPIEKGTSVSALFKRSSFELNITIVGEGTVTEEVIVQPSQYDFETVVRLTAVPSGNWSVFSGWSGDVNNENHVIEVEVTGALNVTASFESVNVIVKTKEQTLALDQIGLLPIELAQTLSIVSGPFHFSESNNNYMLFPGQAWWVAGMPDFGIQARTNENRAPTFSFIKQDGYWEYHKIFPEAGFWGPRHFEIRGNTFFINDGNEIGDSWEGDLFMGEILAGGNISWTRVNSDEEMGYFHGLGVGDLNGDNLLDAAVAPGKNGIQLFYQESDRSFSMDTTKLKVRSRVFTGPFGYANPFTVQIKDLDDDGLAEIITASYGGGDPSTNLDLNDIRVYKINSTTNNYDLAFEDRIPLNKANIGLGATSIKILDVNNDGFEDILVCREGADGQQFVGSFEVWLGEAQLRFNLKFMSPIYKQEEIMFREFLMFDVNNDGLEDLVLRPFDFGSLYRITPNVGVEYSGGVKLNHLIWINQGDGTFSYYDSTPLEVRDILTYNLFPYMEGNILHFMGVYPINHLNGEIVTSDIAVKIED